VHSIHQFGVVHRTDCRRDPAEHANTSKEPSLLHGIQLLNEKDLNMKKISPLRIALAVGTIGLASCAAQPNYQSQYPSQQYPNQTYPSQSYDNRSANVYVGTVDRIEVINRSDPNVAGMVIGGVIGGLLGNQIGHGTGRTVATVAGVAGGAYVGNQIEQRQRAPHESFRVSVRMDNGGYQTVTQDNIADLQTGDRVRVDGNSIARI
jgi:outer membrane lipoprotein SlyB